jgi:hypothetical protein
MKFEPQCNNTKSVIVNTDIWSKLVSLGIIYNLGDETREEEKEK